MLRAIEVPKLNVMTWTRRISIPSAATRRRSSMGSEASSNITSKVGSGSCHGQTHPDCNFVFATRPWIKHVRLFRLIGTIPNVVNAGCSQCFRSEATMWSQSNAKD